MAALKPGQVRTHYRGRVPEEYLARVRAATEAVGAAYDALAEAIRCARAEGANWMEIGRAADMSKQTARNRYGQPLRLEEEDEEL